MNMPLRTLIRHYLKRANEIEKYLTLRPKEWGKFQYEFNEKLDEIFRNIMNFEKANLNAGNEEKVYRLKQFFIGKFRTLFARGNYCVWSIRKPYGYAGDFKIIDDIYLNNPATSGFDRLFDNYFQMSAISVAVRNRKEDFKRIIIEYIKNRNKEKIRIMDLASGPCRDIKEILEYDKAFSERVTVDCYEHDEHAIAYARKLLQGHKNVNFIKENAVRMALKRDIYALVDKRYDFIFSTGLFDYFSERVSIALLKNLKKLMAPGGMMAISDVRDKYSNPSVHFMEWAGDWNLIYRDDESFRQIFHLSGFDDADLEPLYEQQGIMQYFIASCRDRGKK